jgi:hypothetical protein
MGSNGDLDRLAPDVRERVLDRVQWLAAHFEEITPEPLRGRQWRGVFKLRVGDYRISTQPIGANCSLRFTSSVIVAKSIDNACL